MTDIRKRAIQIYDAFTHDHHDRRAMLRQMVALAGTAAAAETLIAAIAASPAVAAQVPADDPALVVRKGSYSIGGGREMTGYFAAPRALGRKVGTVMVIHENRGLNAHIEDVARRVAKAGYFAVAPDFLSDQGGTPPDEDVARDMIGKVDYDAVIAAGVGTLQRLRRLRNGNGRTGAVGFCWGGALVDRVAIAAGDALNAGVSYYGPAPDPAEAEKVQAALLLQYAGEDDRVNATGKPWAAALEKAGKKVEMHVYPGVEHAFNNDTSAERYNAEAAKLAWRRTLDFLARNLDA